VKVAAWHAGCRFYLTVGHGRGRKWLCGVTGREIDQAYEDCDVRQDDERIPAARSRGIWCGPGSGSEGSSREVRVVSRTLGWPDLSGFGR
jgi:hypothetical protein